MDDFSALAHTCTDTAVFSKRGRWRMPVKLFGGTERFILLLKCSNGQWWPLINPRVSLSVAVERVVLRGVTHKAEDTSEIVYEVSRERGDVWPHCPVRFLLLAFLLLSSCVVLLLFLFLHFLLLTAPSRPAGPTAS